jgi:hypothetical protein
MVFLEMAIKQMSVADWRCRICGVLGHKQWECKKESFSDHGDDSSSEFDMENDNKNGFSIFPDYKRAG